jgi:hypothetical protein
MAFHIELRVNLVKTLQVPIFYSSYLNNILNLNTTYHLFNSRIIALAV